MVRSWVLSVVVVVMSLLHHDCVAPGVPEAQRLRQGRAPVAFGHMGAPVLARSASSCAGSFSALRGGAGRLNPGRQRRLAKEDAKRKLKRGRGIARTATRRKPLAAASGRALRRGRRRGPAARAREAEEDAGPRHIRFSTGESRAVHGQLGAVSEAPLERDPVPQGAACGDARGREMLQKLTALAAQGRPPLAAPEDASAAEREHAGGALRQGLGDEGLGELPQGLVDVLTLAGEDGAGDSCSTDTSDSTSEDGAAAAAAGPPLGSQGGRQGLGRPQRAMLAEDGPLSPAASDADADASEGDESAGDESEGGASASESGEAAGSAARLLPRRPRYVEYSAAARLAADGHFQEQLRRWRAGLPNFDLVDLPSPPRPAADTGEGGARAGAGDGEAGDADFEFAYSHDEAAEPLACDLAPATPGARGPGARGPDAALSRSVAALAVPPALRLAPRGDGWRAGGAAARQAVHAPAAGGVDGAGFGAGEGVRASTRAGEGAHAFHARVGMPLADFTRLRAVSKAVHHQRVWGVPPQTSFGVLQPWVNPYYYRPLYTLGVRRLSREQRRALRSAGGWETGHHVPLLTATGAE